MPPRILTEAESVRHPPGACPHCGNPIHVGEEVYQELDAPASPRDAQRAREGRSHVVVTKTAHWACNPRANDAADNYGMTGT